MYFSLFAKQNQAEVWPRFHFRTIGVEWVKVPNAWDPLCLWQCFEYPLDIKESQHRPWPSWDCPERIIFFSVCGNKSYSKSVRKPNSYIILHHQQQSVGQRSLWGKIIRAICEHSAAKIRPVELPILLQLLKLPTICVPTNMHSAICTRFVSDFIIQGWIYL